MSLMVTPHGNNRARQLRVLVAEDDSILRALACRLLVQLGHTVETASDGREAVEAVARRSIRRCIP